VSGSTVTEAAEKAGVARETVSRWVHRDPEFIAELQNRRAEMAAQVRYALEALGKRSVAVLGDAVGKMTNPASKFKAACAVLKLLGADRADTLAATTAEEVRFRLREREDALRNGQRRLEARDDVISRSIDVTYDSGVPWPPPGPTDAPQIESYSHGRATAADRQPSGSNELMPGEPFHQPLELEHAECGHNL
jgi:hypothetical protein